MSPSSGLHPGQSRAESDPEPVSLTIRTAQPVFEVLTSQTARQILAALQAEAKSVSEVAEIVGTSTQNASYHVTNLREAGLIEVVDTWYSEKGREIDLYAARYDSFVLTVGEAPDQFAQEAPLKRYGRGDYTTPSQ